LIQVGADFRQHPVHVAGRELSREGVLLRRMEAAEEPRASAEVVLDTVAEGHPPPRRHPPDGTQHRDQRVLRDPAQHEDRARLEERPLAQEVLAAAADLLGQRLVRRRRAAGGGRDVAVVQDEAVAPRDGRGLAGEAGAVQGREEEVAGAVAREDAARAVAAVRGGREADDEEPRARIAEPRQGPAPVLLVLEPPDLDAGDLEAPRPQARTALARDDVARDAGEGIARASWRGGGPRRPSCPP
jgi:hypothetical protein